MPRGTSLSATEQGQILAFHEDGIGQREIGRRLQRSQRVIYNFLANPAGYNTTKRSGAKKKLSDRQEREIWRISSNHSYSLRSLCSICQLDVCRTTVWNALQRSRNITRQKMNRGPRLLHHHIDVRFGFARVNLTRDWRKVRHFLK